MMNDPCSPVDASPSIRVAAEVQAQIDDAPTTPAYHAALLAALRLPGNILSASPNGRWAKLVWVCCTAAGGDPVQAIPVAAAVEMFMVALDVLDDAEDGEATPLQATLGAARTLNVSTGLLFLAQRSLLGTPRGVEASTILLHAGLRAASGQHVDLAQRTEQCYDLDTALAVTAGKSASLVAAMCHLGALCADADAGTQTQYARFGWCLGMVAQLVNDIVAISPNALDKTDIALQRPTLPIAYAVQYGTADTLVHTTATRTALWTYGPAHVAWVVAETYRNQALALIPALTDDVASRKQLAARLPLLNWTHENGL